MSNKAHELVCRDVAEITKSDMVFNFGMLNNSALKKAINKFGEFYSLKNIDRNIKICLFFQSSGIACNQFVPDLCLLVPFYIRVLVVVPCGGPKKSPRTSI